MNSKRWLNTKVLTPSAHILNCVHTGESLTLSPPRRTLVMSNFMCSLGVHTKMSPRLHMAMRLSSLALPGGNFDLPKWAPTDIALAEVFLRRGLLQKALYLRFHVQRFPSEVGPIQLRVDAANDTPGCLR